MELSKLGVWFHTDALTAKESANLVRRVEALGFGTFWYGEGFGRDPLAHAAFLLAETSEIVIATGIASIYSRDAVAMVGASNALAEQSGGRFILGLGVSMPALVEPRGHVFGPPLEAMRQYLAAMDACHYLSVPPQEPPPVVLAALGPKMLELAAKQTRGAHPCNVTPEYTRRARELMGPDAWLCIEQKVVLESDPSRARSIARAGLDLYLDVPHQQRNWSSLGFEPSDYAAGGSDRLIDALVAWGDTASIDRRIRAHFEAGASQVCIQPLLAEGERIPDDRLLNPLGALTAS
jgi:probable F420-dependent oxidoreductase